MLLTLIINGLMTAASLLLLSMGMAIIFGIMNVVNLAHGELIVIGAYVSFTMIEILKLPFGIAVFASFIVTAIIGGIIEKLIVKKLYGKAAETLLVTYALSMIFQQVIKLIYGSGYIHISSPVSGVVKMGKTVLPVYYICIIGIAILVFAATLLLFNKTRVGMQIRAVSQNRTMAECLGVNVKLIDTLTFAYGAGLTGLAGCIIAPINSISPFVGSNYMVDSFMAVVLGGVDSLFGSVLGSLLMGESNSIIGGYVDSVFAEMIVVFAVVIIIRFKPKGLIVKERR
ncbi:MAG: urea ABC transporter permease subunit UrtB [Bacteroides sp.]|nr:urea ABC transporter permease subunit UrtB [Bacteroides sp.]MCM1549128.1 urea ABC transporter permease subunit UrtB [Clostridium sp.]